MEGKRRKREKAKTKLKKLFNFPCSHRYADIAYKYLIRNQIGKQMFTAWIQISTVAETVLSSSRSSTGT